MIVGMCIMRFKSLDILHVKVKSRFEQPNIAKMLPIRVLQA